MKFSLAKLLALLIASGPKIKQTWALLLAIYETWKAEIEAATPADGHELVELTEEEKGLVLQLSEGLAEDGQQLLFDGALIGKLRGLIKFANEFKDLAGLIHSILTMAKPA